MVIDDIQITCEGFNCSDRELKNYVDYVKVRVPNVNRVHVKMCDDGLVDVNYTARGEKFERIRRITG